MSWIFDIAKLFTDKIGESVRNREVRDRVKWDRVADYFDNIANCLKGMVEQFRLFKIPREHGKELEELARNFERVAYSIYSRKNKKDKAEVGELKSLMDTLVKHATNQHQQLRAAKDSKLDPATLKQGEQLIEDMERAIGRFRGLAKTLRSLEP